MKIALLALLPIAINAGVATTGLQGGCLNRDALQVDELGSVSCDEQVEDENVISEASYAASEASYEIESPATITQDESIGADFGEPQVVDATMAEAILHRIESARSYLKEEVFAKDHYKNVRDICLNKHSNCAFWAVSGECEANPGYMHVNCAPVCSSCDLLHIEARCPLDPDAVDALQPGSLTKMFERILTDPDIQQYEPVLLSRPSYAPGDGPENATYKIGIWMVMFENALSEEEAERMIELGGLKGYERSKDVGEKLPDGSYAAEVNNGRTSTNAWCTDVCYDDPISQTLMQRIAHITGIPEPNQENLQLLRYELSQFYQTHNDYIPYQLERPSGVRILTYYMYLSDVEEGGGTNFPKLDMTVTPKRGRAVLWPSVFDDQPNTKDSRSDHQALPVITGTKYGANAWIHMRDFKTPNAKGC